MSPSTLSRGRTFSHNTSTRLLNKKKRTKSRYHDKVIILDPGHGGVYTGQISIRGKLLEKDVVLDIAKRVAHRLRKRGYTVILTRTADTEFDKKDLIHDLICRAHYTVQYKAHAFVSLHLNGSKNKTIRGYELYVPYEARYPIRSYRLASALHYELSHKIKPIFAGGSLGNHNNIDHGIRASKFNVLTRAHCPAVVVELDYLSNAQSEALLETSQYRDQLTTAVYYGIRRYFAGATKPRCKE